MESRYPESSLERLRELSNQLVSAETQLEQFFELSIDLLAIADVRGFYLKLSKSWEEVLGWTRGELMSIGYMEFVHPEDLKLTMEARKLLLHDDISEFDFINRYRHKDGHYVTLAWRARRVDSQGRIYGVARILSDEEASAHAEKQSHLSDSN